MGKDVGNAKDFFSSDAFMPHGMCYLWRPEILWLHVLSDVLIAVSYFTIPIGIYYFAKRRTDLGFKTIFLLFTAFILLCGITHLVNIVIIWNPLYGPQGLAKLATGIVSAATAFTLWRLIPKALKIPGPQYYKDINDDLTIQIKAREEAEKELQKTNAALESTVQQRTQELEKANANLQEFAYIASHDLRAPLNNVEQLAKFIEEDLDGKVDKDTSDNIDLILQRVSRMKVMLNDILSYAKADDFSSAPEPVDTAEVVEEVTTWIDPPEGFSVSAESNLPVIEIEKSFMEQVLLNLISNAIKHHDRDTGAINVSYKVEGRFHVFSVSDDGPGIPANHHARILKMFQKLKSRDEVEGSGIGLAVVQKLITSKGGELKILSPALNDRGTTFSFSLPI